MSVKAVIFDFGNVLGTFDKVSASIALAKDSPLSAEEILTLITKSGLEKEFESGRLTNNAFCAEVRRRCQLSEKMSNGEIQKIWGDIFDSNTVINPIVDQLIKRGTKIGVLSNTNAIHWPYISSLPIMRLLSEHGAPMVLSFRVGAYKPERILYETALQSLGALPNEALYLDDIEDYVSAARALGMSSEQYDCTKDPERIHHIMKTHGLLV